MSNSGIYVVTSPTNKVYVGQSRNVWDRVRKYKNLNCKHQTKLYYSLKKYGLAAHTFEIVMALREDFPVEWLTWLEQFYMDYYRAEGYELMNIREAGNKSRLSEETKAKLSKLRTGVSHFSHTEKCKAEASVRMTGAGNHRFKGYVKAYKNGVLLGEFEGGKDFQRKTGIDCKKLYSYFSGELSKSSPYTFTREPLQK